MNRNIWVTSDKENAIRKDLALLESEKERTIQREYRVYSPLANGIFFAPISDDKLGAFYPDSKYIILNEELLDNSIPATIRNVFIHELAHGMDYLLNGQLSGHSTRFREYCSFLGIEEGFDKAKVRANITKERKIESRIEKLIALSSSPFENEALAALKKAQELMVESNKKYSGEERLYISELYESKRVPFYVTKLCSFVSMVSGVFIVKCKTEYASVLRAYGDFEQVEFSLYLFDYLSNAVDKEASNLRRGGKRITKDSFVMGAIPEMERKLSLSAKEASTALLIIQDKNKQKAKRLVFGKGLRTICYNPRSISKESYDLGGDFARTLDIPAGIKQRKLT